MVSFREKPVKLEQGPFNYEQTEEMVHAFFGWDSGYFTRLVVKTLSKIVKPLDEGSHQGKQHPGSPHRTQWVNPGPLTIFTLSEAGRWRRVLLAARTRHLGALNVMDLTTGGGKLARNRNFLAGRRKKQTGEEHEINPSYIEQLKMLSTGRRMIGTGNALVILIDLQKQSTYPVVVVPVARAFHQKARQAPTDSIISGMIRYMPWNLFSNFTSWVRTFRTGSLKTGRPLVLKTWLETAVDPQEDSRSLAGALRVELQSRLEAEARVTAGPPRPVLRDIRRRVLSDPYFAAFMQDYAVEKGMDHKAVYREARGYINEIASDYRVGVVRWMSYFIQWLFDRSLQGIDFNKKDMRLLSECDSRKRILIVSSHKSYIDPFLIDYPIYRSGMMAPHQAAGVNLNFWPVGWILGHCGAFYLRRTFQGEDLYREVFSAYIRFLIANNFTTVLYIEGSRSRDGKIRKPRLGLVKIVSEALSHGVCEDIIILPVFTGWDKVPEEPYHIREMAGGKKTAESTMSMAKIIRSMTTTHGLGYVKFGKPLSMKELNSQGDLMQTGLKIAREIDRVTPVNGRGVTAAALLKKGTAWVSRAEVEEAAATLIDRALGFKLYVNTDMDGVSKTIKWFIDEGHIAEKTQGGIDGYKIRKKGRRFLEYNKNIIICHFLEDALVASALASREGSWKPGSPVDCTVVGERVGFLFDLFSEEFNFKGEEERKALMDSALSYIPCSDEQRAAANVSLFRSLLRSKIEGYIISMVLVGTIEEGKLVSRDDMIRKYMDTGETMLGENRIRGLESVSKITFDNSFGKLTKLGIVERMTESYGEADRQKVFFSRGPDFDNLQGLLEKLESFSDEAGEEDILEDQSSDDEFETATTKP